jgi:hypothetical protein
LVQVAHGELTEAPLETLSALAQSVFLPLLTARINQEGWPDVVAQEVSDSMHRLVATGVLAASQQIQARRAWACIPNCASKLCKDATANFCSRPTM